MFILKRLFKRKNQSPPPEEIPNNVADFIWDTNCDMARTFIEFNCPWVKFDDLNTEEKQRYINAAISYWAALEGYASFTPEEVIEDARAKGLIPPIPDEWFDEFLKTPAGQPYAEFIDGVVKLFEELESLPDEPEETEELEVVE